MTQAKYDEALFKQDIRKRVKDGTVNTDDIEASFWVAAWDLRIAIEQHKPEKMEEVRTFVHVHTMPTLLHYLDDLGLTLRRYFTDTDLDHLHTIIEGTIECLEDDQDPEDANTIEQLKAIYAETFSEHPKISKDDLENLIEEMSVFEDEDGAAECVDRLRKLKS